MNEPLDPRTEAELEARLRAHYADRAARELPGGATLPTPLVTRVWYRRPPMLAAAAALLVVGMVGTAVLIRDDEPERLDVTDSSTSTTTTLPSTTSVPTTTTTPPAAAVRSVIVSVEGVVGWWDGARFVRWDDGTVPLSGGEVYALVALDGSTSAVGSAPRPGCGVDPSSGPPDVDIPGLEFGALLEPVRVAVTGVPVPTPRPVVAIGAEPYTSAAADALAGLGVRDGSPEIVQALRTDFEGDGSDEVLLVVERISDPETLVAEPGDYSVLLLRQVVDGEVVTTVLSESIADPGPGEVPSGTITRVVAAADLNGDGAMELVTRRVVWEASSSSVLVVDPAGGASAVLEVGCGV